MDLDICGYGMPHEEEYWGIIKNFYRLIRRP